MKKVKLKQKFTEDLNNQCSELIRICKKNPDEVDARNKLYMLLKDWMNIWITSILHNWHRTETQEEILSLSWDTFYFALKHYKIDNPIPSHFYNYVRYYLLNRYAKKESVHISLEELKDVLALVPSSHHDKFGKLLTLFQLTEVIPEDHRIVWNDAMQSISTDQKGVCNYISDMKMNRQSYYELKKSFKEIIKFILK